MSEALPALSLGLINSVIAPFAKPPPVALSKKDKPVLKCVPGSNCFCGKRSASSFLRSTTLPGVPIQKKMAQAEDMFKRTFTAKAFGVSCVSGVVRPAASG